MEFIPKGEKIVGIDGSTTTNQTVFSGDGQTLVFTSVDNEKFTMVLSIYKWYDNKWNLSASFDEEDNIVSFTGSLTIDTKGENIALGVPFDKSGTGHVNFYSLYSITKEWKQATTIYGVSSGDGFGYSLSMSGNGKKIIIGAPYRRVTGSVYYASSGFGKWEIVGDELRGSNNNGRFGASVAINERGNIIFVASPTYDGTWPTEYGLINVYSMVSGAWAERGRGVQGKVEYESFGMGLSCTLDGDCFVAGGPFMDKGYARVYVWNGNDWVQKGSDIVGEDDTDGYGEGLGVSVAISGNGNRIIIGSPYYVDNKGVIRVYDWNEREWTLVYSLTGEKQGEGFDEFGNIAGGDFFGQSVSISNDGNDFSVAAPQTNNGAGYIVNRTVPKIDTPCFTQDASFVTDDGVKNILSLKKNDKVKTIDGNFYQVTNIFRFPTFRSADVTVFPSNYFEHSVPNSRLTLSSAHYINYDGIKKSDTVDLSINTRRYVDFFYHIQIDKEGEVDYVLANNLGADVWCRDHPYVVEYKKYGLF